jgi:hypothetical protein
MSKHISLEYNNSGVERKIEIDETDQGIFLSIRKMVKGLEHEFEDVLLTKKECRELAEMLLIKGR